MDPTSYSFKINTSLDLLINQCNSDFKTFLVAYYLHTLGQDNLNNISDHAILNVNVGAGIEMEPIPIGHLKEFNNTYPAFLFEVFHGKLVQAFNICLDDLFCTLLDLHINGTRFFTELGKRSLNFDFASGLSNSEQIRSNMYDNFKFFNYSERHRIINTSLNQTNEGQKQQAHIRQNILIRNCFQHRKGIVDNHLLKELGRQKVEILDDKGNLREFGLAANLMLSIPELYAFKKSLLRLAQIWRIENE